MKQIIVRLESFIHSPWQKRILYTVIGALAGYAYYHFIGCSSGSCPITSNPWRSSIYGAAAGFFIAIGGHKKNQTFK